MYKQRLKQIHRGGGVMHKVCKRTHGACMNNIFKRTHRLLEASEHVSYFFLGAQAPLGGAHV